jgi:hypothetical protein
VEEPQPGECLEQQAGRLAQLKDDDLTACPQHPPDFTHDGESPAAGHVVQRVRDEDFVEPGIGEAGTRGIANEEGHALAALPLPGPADLAGRQAQA